MTEGVTAGVGASGPDSDAHSKIVGKPDTDCFHIFCHKKWKGVELNNLSLIIVIVIILWENDLRFVDIKQKSGAMPLWRCGRGTLLMWALGIPDSCGLMRGWNLAVPHRGVGCGPRAHELTANRSFPRYFEPLHFLLYFYCRWP